MPTVTLTPIAKEKLQEYLREEPSETVVRLLVEEDGRFGLSLDQKASDDAAFHSDEIPFVIESMHQEIIDGLRIDYLVQGAASGFSLTGGRPRPRGAQGVLRVEPTPNPDALKFVLGFSLGSESRTWSPENAEGAAPAIKQLFGIPGVVGVFELENFVTITRAPGSEWPAIEAQAKAILATLAPPAEGQRQKSSWSEGSLEERLERFIREDVAPFLQQDGGDIEFVGYDEGTVKVRLRGACGTCPSSLMTLQGGVERRLVAEFPDQVHGLQLVS